MKTTTLNIFYTLLFVIVTGLSAIAQKLPNVQSVGLYAPTGVKVDGKAAEWGNDFQAYNKGTAVFYTMANNADNLFLTVKSTDKTAIGKILGGGLTLTITDKNKPNGSIDITTPITTAPSRSNIAQAVGKSESISDSLLNVLNKSLASNFKAIKLNGIKAIPDSAISIYNDYGIKVAGQLNNHKEYICELTIPLKYLNNPEAFNYNITLNGVPFQMMTIKPNGQTVSTGPAEAMAGMANVIMDGSPMLELTSPTDLSGTYTLAKKQ